MELVVNRQSQLPIHVQLKAQLSHLIQARQLAPGTQLPTVRQLAGFLRINRNTAARVFADLEREGYLRCEKGRGTFVAQPSRERGAPPLRMNTLARLVDETLKQVQRLGFGGPEFAAALYTRAHAAPAPVSRKLRVLFTECNRPQLRQFSQEIEQTLPLRVDTLLVKDLERRCQQAPEFLQRYSAVVTTFWHIHEVQKLLRRAEVEVVALMADASLESLMRLTRLPEGTKVGIACHEWTGSENLRHSIENAGLTHIRLIMGCGAELESLKQMVKEARVVVCTSLVAKLLRRVAPRGVEIIVDDRTLNKGGLEMLRQRLAQLAAGIETRGAKRARQ